MTPVSQCDRPGRVRREADAKALETIVGGIEAKFAPWLQTTRAIAADLESLNGFRWQSGQLAGFFRYVAAEAEIALRLTLDDLAGSIPTVAAGTGNEKLRIGVEPVRPEPEIIVPTTTRLFALRAVKWTDASGKLQRASKFSDVDLSAEAAARALECGACVPVDDPRRREVGGSSPQPPRDEWCTSLDPATVPPTIELKDGFERPYLATVKA
jgi:hypothetical protein